MEQVMRWLMERPTPLLWLSGPSGSGKTSAAESAVQALGSHAAVLRLSAFGPDGALSEVAIEDRGRLTTNSLLQFAISRHVLVLDGLDSLQQVVGQNIGDITDCRFRHLLLAACEQARPIAIIV